MTKSAQNHIWHLEVIKLL